MKNLLIIIIFSILIFLQCASKPEIIRKFIPYADKNYIASFSNTAVINIKKVKIKIKYLNKIELQEMAKRNNPYLDNDSVPLLTTFKITLYNDMDSKIEFNPQESVLLDGLGNQFSALTYDTFKELYPSTIYKEYQYSFIFNRYYMEEHYTDDYYKRGKAGKTLFKGGKIYSGVHVTGILAFPRVSELSKEVRLILPGIKFYKKNIESGSSEEIKIRFRQKIVRIE